MTKKWHLLCISIKESDMVLTQEGSHKKSKHSTLHEQELSQLWLQKHIGEHLHFPTIQSY